MNKVLAVFFGISILANVILGLMYVGQRTMVTQAEENKKETIKQIVQLKTNHIKRKKLILPFNRMKPIMK